MGFKQDFRAAYGAALIQMAGRWIWRCDDGCFQDTRNRDTWAEGSVIAIYQPHKTMQVRDFKRVNKTRTVRNFRP